MSRRSLFALALILSANLAFAIEPKAIVKPPAQVDPGEIVLLDGSESTGDAFEWFVPPGGKQPIRSESGRSAYFATGRPGTYQFTLIVGGTVGGKVKLDIATVSVVVSGSPPVPPGPTPDPTPTPTPTPDPPSPTPSPIVAGRLFATYIADAEALLPSHAAMKAAPVVRKAFRDLDATWRWYGNDEAEPRSLGLLQHVDKFPSVLIQSQDGRIVATLAAPSEADVVAKVKQLRGSK